MSGKTLKLLATFFYVGDIPLAPGSAASMVGVLIYMCLYSSLGLYVITVLTITILGFMVCGRVERMFNERDPSFIVIDEVAGVLLAFFMLPLTWPVLLTAFFLFRAFDMFKLYPVNKFEDIQGSAGVMLDDLFAGLYTNLTMHVAMRLAGMV